MCPSSPLLDGRNCDNSSQSRWLLALVLLGGTLECVSVRADLEPMWLPGDQPGEVRRSEPDSYAAFRGRFILATGGEVEIRLIGASWFNVWLDEEFTAEGPARFPRDFPQYDTIRADLSAGPHVIATAVTYIGTVTWLLKDFPPFFACEVLKDGKPVAVDWRCLPLPAYRPQVRRINRQLGWVEWCDLRKIPVGWKRVPFNDLEWATPGPQTPDIGEPSPLTIATALSSVHKVSPIAEGPLADVFGYLRDDPTATFFLRDLQCKRLPSKGVWRRYDLGRVRLGRPRFVLDLPEGSIVEFGYSEYLLHDRVAPYIDLSGGPSCNLDHYVARGGVQEIFPLTPKGGRFFEVHILGDPEQIGFIEEEFVERGYYGEPEGGFACSDKLLSRIWATGIETLRACAEDAFIDNPTRERGQWGGGTVTVGMDIAACGYSDLRLVRRGLVHCAQSARDDGLVAGLCPGSSVFLTTCAAQWVTRCLHYWELTGDRSVLEELFPAAENNLAAFEGFLTTDGLKDEMGWGFVDWGYVRNHGPSDMGVNLHYLVALKDMQRWCAAVGRDDRIHDYRRQEEGVRQIVERWLAGLTSVNGVAWDIVGYHRAILALQLGLVQEPAATACEKFIQEHMLACFPNDPDAPRNDHPSLQESRLITPYFAHYAMPPLIERGHMNFVLDQYRTCWGWALGEGRTTWLEVFDTRWSHCHQWAGSPTWQLSRYVLGLTPRFDLGERHFHFFIAPGDLKHASGKIPLPGADPVNVEWRKASRTRLDYRIAVPKPITLHMSVSGHAATGDDAKVMRIEGDRTLPLAETDGYWRIIDR